MQTARWLSTTLGYCKSFIPSVTLINTYGKYRMQNKFVKVNFDLHCDWHDKPPPYRIYVNHELFTERTYTWSDTQFLCECLSLNAPPGKYSIRVDNLGEANCQFKIRNINIEAGPARIIDSKTFEITNESA